MIKAYIAQKTFMRDRATPLVVTTDFYDMSIEIRIKTAVFKCQTDEDIFYQRLRQVTGVENVSVQNTLVCLLISNQYKTRALKEVTEICSIWHTSFEMLT